MPAKFPYDVIVIGGGAAGIMAAITAARTYPEKKIALLDRTFALGRKILVCGAGRCNVTNINLSPQNYYGDSKFISTVLAQFPLSEIEAFFADLGVSLYVEQKTDIGKMFPTTNQAQTITAVLEAELQLLGVEVFLNHDVIGISKGEQFNLQVNEITKTAELVAVKEFVADDLILSAGGKTYPALGANGSGYRLVESLGHSVLQPVPSALPLEVDSKLCREAAGLRHDCEVWSYVGIDPSASQEQLLKYTKTDSDNLMFTNYGLSGPVILNLSREISIRMNREHRTDCFLRVNFLPGLAATDTAVLLQQRWQRRPQQSLLRSLFGILPNKLALAICHYLSINPDAAVVDLRSTEVGRLVELLSGWIVAVKNTRGWNEAEFTAGGVSTEEVDTNLESTIMPRLFLAGEILNVDGDVGGFNLSWAWASGSVAGRLGNS